MHCCDFRGKIKDANVEMMWLRGLGCGVKRGDLGV